MLTNFSNHHENLNANPNDFQNKVFEIELQLSQFTEVII